MEMKYFLFSLFMLSCQTGLPAAESALHLDDSGQLLSTEPDWLNTCEKRLNRYEHLTGIKIVMEFHLKSPSEEEDKKPGAYMHALARKRGVDRGGVLIVYFHDDPDWRVWIGDDLTNVFTGKPGTVKELTASEAIHNVKEAMLTAARVKADAEIARRQQDAPVAPSLTTAQRLIIQADALLDALMVKFDPK